MFQLIIPGFEKFFSSGHMDEVIYNPEKTADYFEEKGFFYLEDFPAGGLGKKNEDFIPYIPYRIKFPSGRILDEKEVYEKLELPLDVESRKEIVEAFYYFNSLYHESINVNRKFSGITFLNEADMEKTIKKYSRN